MVLLRSEFSVPANSDQPQMLVRNYTGAGGSPPPRNFEVSAQLTSIDSLYHQRNAQKVITKKTIKLENYSSRTVRMVVRSKSKWL